jgi:polysaccharide transporter, PST family
MDADWTKWLPRVFRKHIVGRHNLQAMLGNSSWLLLDKVVRMVLGLFVGTWIARYLGPTEFGQLNYAIAFVALFSAIATLGLDNIVVRDLVRRPEDREKILGSAFSLKLLGALLSLAMAETAIRLLQPGDARMHLLVGVTATALVFQAFDVIDFLFQSGVRSKPIVLVRMISFVLFSFVKIALIVSLASLIEFAWAALGELALAALGFIWVFQRYFGVKWFGFGDLSTVRSLLKDSWPFLLSSLAIMVYIRIDQIMLASAVGSYQVGLYSAALKLSEIWYVIPMAIVGSVAPSLTATHGQSRAVYYSRLQRLFTSLMKLAYLVAVPMSLLSTPLIVLLFGPQYAGAGPVLAIHVWTAVFVFMGVATGPWVVNEGLGKLQFYRTFIGAVMNIFLNLYLIPRYGAIGAAIATLLSQALVGYFSFVFLNRTREVFGMMTKALLLRS